MQRIVLCGNHERMSGMLHFKTKSKNSNARVKLKGFFLKNKKKYR
tara:strand:- start:728 stop:862 length:135 start_codon:yes stop_codon:yes gene_type:complete